MSMSTVNESGSTTFSRRAPVNPCRHGVSDEDGGRGRWVGTIAGVAVAAAGTASVAAGLALPSILGGLNLGNHNEMLLSAAVEPDERGNRH